MKKILVLLAFFATSCVAMAQVMEEINIGTSPNSGTGDNLRAAMTKTKNNFSMIADTTSRHNDRLKALELGGVAVGDTIEFSDGSQVRMGDPGAIEIFTPGSAGQAVTAVTDDYSNNMELIVPFLRINDTDTTNTGAAAGRIVRIDDELYLFTATGWSRINGSSAGGAIPDNQLAIGTGTGIEGSGTGLTYNGSVLNNNGYTTFNDSVYLDYIGAGSITGGVYLLLSPTQAIDTGKATTGAIGMRMPLRPIYVQVADTINGEMLWWYFDRVQNKWAQKYGVITSDPIATDEAHTVQIELLTRYIYDLQKQIDALKPRRIFTRRSK